MKRTLALIAALMSCAFGAGQKPVVTVVGNAIVTLQSTVTGTPFVAVQKVRIYHGFRNDTGEDCSVISGDIVTRLPNRLFDVDVTIELYRVHTGGNWVIHLGTAKAVVKQAAKGAPTQFRALGPAVLPPNWGGKLPSSATLHFTAAFKVRNPSATEH